MPRTSIKVSNIINASSKGTTAQNRVSNVESGINSIRGSIDGKILGRNNINGRLINVKNTVGQIENDIAAICAAISNGAIKYQQTENIVVNMSRDLGAVYTKAVTQGGIVSQGYSDYFHDVSMENNAIVDKQLTESQQVTIAEAIKNADVETALNILGVSDATELSEEDFNLLKEVYYNCGKGLGDTVKDATGVTGAKDAISGIEWDVFTAALGASGPNITKFAGWINTSTAIARGPQTANSFVIVNPQVASKTATMTGVGSKLTTAMNSTAAKIGIPVVGGVIDYCIMRSDGEEVGDALVKATAHVGIGLAGGALGAKIGGVVGGIVGSVFPGVGTVAVGAIGAVVGFVAGVAITTVGNAIFDTVYDNWDNITAWADEKGQQIADGLNAAKDWAIEKGKQIADVADEAIDAAKVWAQEKGEQIADGLNNAKDWAVEKGQQIVESADKAVDAAVDWVQEKGEKVSEFFDGIGDAVSSGWNLLGGIFG